MNKLLETKNLYVDFNTFEGSVKALNGVNLVVKKGETYGLVGESGCGKSVTVRSMMKIVQPPGKIRDGEILLFFSKSDEEHYIDLLKRSEVYAESIRGNEISMIFQEANASLNPVLTIGDQVGESFLLHRRDEVLTETINLLEKKEAKNFFSRGWKKFILNLYKREHKKLKKVEEKEGSFEKEKQELKTIPYPATKFIFPLLGIAAILGLLSLITKNRTISLLGTVSFSLFGLLSLINFIIKLINGFLETRFYFRARSRLFHFMKKVPFVRGFMKYQSMVVKKMVLELLTSLGIPNPGNTIKRYPHELSGGMQQRIVIAMALACHPTLLIADEPTSNLDVTIQAQILKLIKELKQERITSVLFITHDLGVVAEICDRVTVMYAGDVMETAAVEVLFKTPLHPYTKGLIHSVPKIEQEEALATIPGNVPNLIHAPSGCRFHPRCPHVMDICRTQKPEQLEYEEDHFVSCHLYTKGGRK